MGKGRGGSCCNLGLAGAGVVFLHGGDLPTRGGSALLNPKPRRRKGSLKRGKTCKGKGEKERCRGTGKGPAPREETATD